MDIISRDSNNAWYALRRTMPPFSFEQNLKEAISVLQKYKVDELILKIDVEEFWHGQPDYDRTKKYQEKLFIIKNEMSNIGIVYSLNPWITVGHGDFGRTAIPQISGFQAMVGHDGSECKCCACPLSNAWRENTAKIWSLYAETAPSVMWCEDDLRIVGHKPVEWSCFCPLHIKMFCDRIGHSVTRDELVDAILSPGEPHSWRKEYLNMQGDIMTDTVRFIAKVVHEISPSTCMGLMSSGPALHAVEGRPWAKIANALSGKNVLYSRPTLGNYSETAIRGLYYSANSIKATRYCLPGNVVEQTEVENVPFTQYANSVNFTFLKMVVSFAFGCNGVTLNLFDHCGTSMELEPKYGEMLGEKKTYLNALASFSQRVGPLRGVRVLHHDKAGFNNHLDKRHWKGLSADGDIWASALEAHGIPTIYDDNVVTTAACGQIIRSFSDNDIKAMLSKGLLLDGEAAEILSERGFGDAIGVKSISAKTCVDDLGAFAAEEYYNPEFEGEKHKFLTIRFPVRPNIHIIEPLNGARVISQLVNADAVRQHTMTYAFENSQGGRVVVYALNMASSYSPRFNGTFRMEQLQSVVKWLSRGRAPLIVTGGTHPLCLRKDAGDVTLIGLFNLCLDPWISACFELYDTRNIGNVSLLTEEGEWSRDIELEIKNSSTGHHVIKFNKSIYFNNPLFLSVKWT